MYEPPQADLFYSQNPDSWRLFDIALINKYEFMDRVFNPTSIIGYNSQDKDFLDVLFKIS